MKIFVTGVNGQLGHDVVNELIGRGYEAFGSGTAEKYSGKQDGTFVCSAPYYQLDIRDREKVLQLLEKIRPDAVIHCAAWTDVDGAEDRRSEVLAVNSNGTANIKDACKYLDCKLMYISTDYVFNGRGTDPWSADSLDYDPVNVYGLSKMAGEQAVTDTMKKFFIVRISWVFGSNGKNFVDTMLHAGQKYPKLRVVDDQIGRPTYTLDLAVLLADMIATDKYGIYHASNEGEYISWYDFAKEIFRQANMSVEVVPVSTEEYGISKAKRPMNSRLDTGKLAEQGFRQLPVWQDALERYLVASGSR